MVAQGGSKRGQEGDSGKPLCSETSRAATCPVCSEDGSLVLVSPSQLALCHVHQSCLDEDDPIGWVTGMG